MPQNHTDKHSQLPDFACHTGGSNNGSQQLHRRRRDLHDGTKGDTINKNALRAALLAQLDQLAVYVELNSGNDPAVMTSSGFNLASTIVAKMAHVSSVTITALNLKLAMWPQCLGHGYADQHPGRRVGWRRVITPT